jgi:hypothetical protein
MADAGVASLLSPAGTTKRMSKKTFKPGDEVAWSSSQGKISGTVEKKLTAPSQIKGHHVAASADNPEYLVQSAKTGAQAAHKPGALKKKS